MLHYSFIGPRAAFIVRMIDNGLEKWESSILIMSFGAYRHFHDSERSVVHQYIVQFVLYICTVYIFGFFSKNILSTLSLFTVKMKVAEQGKPYLKKIIKV